MPIRGLIAVTTEMKMNVLILTQCGDNTDDSKDDRNEGDEDQHDEQDVEDAKEEHLCFSLLLAALVGGKVIEASPAAPNP